MIAWRGIRNAVVEQILVQLILTGLVWLGVFLTTHNVVPPYVSRIWLEALIFIVFAEGAIGALLYRKYRIRRADRIQLVAAIMTAPDVILMEHGARLSLHSAREGILALITKMVTILGTHIPAHQKCAAFLSWNDQNGFDLFVHTEGHSLGLETFVRTMTLENSLAGQVIATKRAIRLADVRHRKQDEHWLPAPQSLNRPNVSCVGVPITTEDSRTHGVLCMEARVQWRMTEEDLALMGVFARKAAFLYNAIEE